MYLNIIAAIGFSAYSYIAFPRIEKLRKLNAVAMLELIQGSGALTDPLVALIRILSCCPPLDFADTGIRIIVSNIDMYNNIAGIIAGIDIFVLYGSGIFNCDPALYGLNDDTVCAKVILVS